MGIVTGGWLMAKGALAAERRLAAGDGDAAFHRAKIMTARFLPSTCCAPAPALLAGDRRRRHGEAFELAAL